LTLTAPGTIETAPLNLFRSSLFVAIVSLFVLTGYAGAVMDQCCTNEKQELVSHDNSAPSNDDGCQCLCHKILTNALPKTVGLPVLAPTFQVYFLSDEFPPDAVSKGIDHPPQLA
jgi:hypothetical protein